MIPNVIRVARYWCLNLHYPNQKCPHQPRIYLWWTMDRGLGVAVEPRRCDQDGHTHRVHSPWTGQGPQSRVVPKAWRGSSWDQAWRGWTRCLHSSERRCCHCSSSRPCCWIQYTSRSGMISIFFLLGFMRENEKKPWDDLISMLFFGIFDFYLDV